MEYTIVYPDELYHHGIKGQKWGVRRFQNYDGSLKSAGVSHFKALAAKYKRGSGESKKRPRIKKPKLGKHPVQSLQSKAYQKTLHMSKKDADEAAKKKADTMKKVAIGLGVGAAVVGAGVGIYAYKKYGKSYFDSSIKAGTTVQTLSKDKNRLDNGTSWYTAHKANDMKVYVGKFGQDTVYNSKGQAVKRGKYALQAETSKNIKVMGERNGTQLFNKMYKENSEFRDLLDKAKKENYDLKDYDNYKVFNKSGIVSNKESSRKAQQMFYDEAKKRGYGAIADLTDRDKHSDFRTESNIIIDNSNFKKNSAGSITKNNVRRITSGEEDAGLDYWNKREKRHKNVERFVNKTLPRAGAAVAGTAIVGTAAGHDAKVAYQNYKKQSSKQIEDKKKRRK